MDYFLYHSFSSLSLSCAVFQRTVASAASLSLLCRNWVAGVHFAVLESFGHTVGRGCPFCGLRGAFTGGLSAIARCGGPSSGASSSVSRSAMRFMSLRSVRFCTIGLQFMYFRLSPDHAGDESHEPGADYHKYEGHFTITTASPFLISSRAVKLAF